MLWGREMLSVVREQSDRIVESSLWVVRPGPARPAIVGSCPFAGAD